MFTRLSLKYQIAVTIVVLAAIVLALSLERTLSAFMTSTRSQIERAEQTVLTLLQDTGRQALITEEYEHARKVFAQALGDPYVNRVLLADAANRVMLSTSPEDVGSPLPPLTETAERFWRTYDFTNNTGKLGLLALEFSNAPLVASRRTAQNLGVGIGATGLILIGGLGLGMGFVLTQRLGQLSHAAQRLTAGDSHVETGLSGQDEIAQVGRAFDTMSQRIADNRKRLTDAHTFLQSTLDSLSAHIAILDETGTILAVNAVWRRFAEANAFLGASHGVGMNYLNICETAAGDCADEAPEIAQGIRAVMAGEREHFELEYPCHSPTEQRWFVAKVTCFESPDGLRVVVAHENISKRKQAEERLRESEEQFRSIVDGSIQGIGIHQDGVVQFANPALLDMLGYDHPSDLIGQSYLVIIAPHERARLEGYREARARDDSPPSRYDFQAVRADGAMIWVECLVTRLLWGGQPSTLAAFVDITERKQAESALRESEEKFRSLVEGSVQAVLIQRHGKPLYANQALADLHGFATPEDLLQVNSFFDLIAPHERAEVMQLIKARERGEPPPRHRQLQALHQDGTVFWTEYTVSIVPWEGAPADMVTIMDITERKQAEDILLRSHDELERRVKDRTAALEAANEEVRRFAYIVSHDLRAPLINLKGFAGELSDLCKLLNTVLPQLLPHLEEPQRTEVTRALTVDGPEALGFIEASVTRMDGLIRGVLDLSRAGRRELHIEPVDTEALAQHIAQTLTHQLAQSRARLTIEPLPTVNADRIAMEQILGNLMGNAVKYLDSDRPGEITVRAERGAETTTFQVCDNGRGIAEGDISRVFELFRRVGRQDKLGEGMGLAYVQTLVRRHGGEITCQSTLGVGTTFSFTMAHHLVSGEPDAVS